MRTLHSSLVSMLIDQLIGAGCCWLVTQQFLPLLFPSPSRSPSRYPSRSPSIPLDPPHALLSLSVALALALDSLSSHPSTSRPSTLPPIYHCPSFSPFPVISLSHVSISLPLIFTSPPRPCMTIHAWYSPCMLGTRSPMHAWYPLAHV